MDILFVVKSLDFDLQEEQLADSEENGKCQKRTGKPVGVCQGTAIISVRDIAKVFEIEYEEREEVFLWIS